MQRTNNVSLTCRIVRDLVSTGLHARASSERRATFTRTRWAPWRRRTAAAAVAVTRTETRSDLRACLGRTRWCCVEWTGSRKRKKTNRRGERLRRERIGQGTPLTRGGGGFEGGSGKKNSQKQKKKNLKKKLHTHTRATLYTRSQGTPHTTAQDVHDIIQYELTEKRARHGDTATDATAATTAVTTTTISAAAAAADSIEQVVREWWASVAAAAAALNGCVCASVRGSERGGKLCSWWCARMRCCVNGARC